MESIASKNKQSPELVSMWGEFIDWEKRRVGEDNFLIKQFHAFGAQKIFDASLGDGCDSIYLLQRGFEVISNEIDESFRDKARENAKIKKVKLKIFSLDWRALDTKIPARSFDAVILLGNSLTYLFDKNDQIKTLQQFRRILRRGGILIIDERNYQYILDNREIILRGNFQYSGKYVYCGDEVHGRPVEISRRRVKMEYIDERTGKSGYLVLYPFFRGEMKKLLNKAGFTSVKQYSDYTAGEKHQADFYQYVCIK